MLKILQINVINKTASTGRTTMELGHEIEMAGMQSRIAVAIGERGENVYLIGSKLEHKIHAILSRIFGVQGYFSYFGTKRLLRYMDKEKPDVVHLRNLHGNYINLPLLFSYLKKNCIPTVITLHDCWFYTGKCCHYTTVDCFKWLTGQCKDCPKLKDDNVSWFFDWTSKMIRDKKKYIDNLDNLIVVGVSQWIVNEAKNSYVFSNVRNIEKIYNWIDESVFYPRQNTKIKEQLGLENKFVILSVASGWSNKKGLDKIKKIASKLPADMVIVLAGQCSDDIKEKNIILVGETKSMDELAELYSAADVYLNMSVEESFGKVSAESLMCGTPIIAFDSTANPEIVGENCGYVIKNFNEEGIILILEEIKEKTKKSYASSCLAFAKENFSKKANAKKYIDLYKKTVKIKGKTC